MERSRWAQSDIVWERSVDGIKEKINVRAVGAHRTDDLRHSGCCQEANSDSQSGSSLFSPNSSKALILFPSTWPAWVGWTHRRKHIL